jgi:hypothetical protein
MRGPETRLRIKIVEALKFNFPGLRPIKIHGNQYQEAGITDLICCYKGLFIAIEVKQPGEFSEPIQARFQKTIRDAGGYAARHTSPKKAVYGVRKWLTQRRKNYRSKETE